MASVKILVVEDEKIVAKDIASSLKNLGYIVLGLISSGEEAIQKALETRPDLVLMDIILKGEMDGVQAADQIQAELNIPVIFLTAHADESTLERAKLTDPFGYILKPFHERDLHTTIEIALRRHAAEAQMRSALEAEILVKDQEQSQAALLDRDRVESEIKQAVEREKELEELKSRFVSMVSHEFRTPLASILLSTGLLQEYSQKWTQERKDAHFQRIHIAVQRMVQLLEDTLTLNQAESQQLQFNPQWLDVVEFCHRLIADIRLQTDDVNSFTYSTSGSCHSACLDVTLLRSLLETLLMNAMKYSAAGSPIHLELICEPDITIFRVQDSGMGIPSRDWPHIFDAFYRGSNVGTIAGTGLGLAIAKEVVDLHRGTITFTSLVGKGTTFTVHLPTHS